LNHSTIKARMHMRSSIKYNTRAVVVVVVVVLVVVVVVVLG
jgi:hypothetical protein